MLNKIKQYVLIVMTGLTFAAPALVPLTVSATTTCSTIASSVSEGANGASNTNGGKSDCGTENGVNDTSIAKLAQKIVTTFSVVVGIVAVIMIIVGGFRYITSGGDSGKVGNAKNSLIYAIVGLIIVALAQLIVHFVLNQSSNITTAPAAATP